MKRLLAFALVLAAAGTGVATGCGGDERPPREEFTERLQSIDMRGGELWARLAAEASRLEPDEPLPLEVERRMRDVVEFQRRATDELERLNPPEGAEEEIEALVEALDERTTTFERVMAAGFFTRRDSSDTTQAGDKIDQAFEQLRSEGFLPTAETHAESHGTSIDPAAPHDASNQSRIVDAPSLDARHSALAMKFCAGIANDARP